MTPSNAKGYALAQALEEYSDPDAWASYMAIERHCLKEKILLEHLGYPVLDITGGSPKWRRLSKNLETARRLLDEHFVNRLRAGELSATGFLHPMSATSEPIWIPADQWRVLNPRFSDSTAAGGGISYEGVRVYQAKTESAYTLGADQRPEAKKLVGAGPGTRQSRALKREHAKKAMIDLYGAGPWPQPSKAVLFAVNVWLKQKNHDSVSPDTLARAIKEGRSASKA